MDTLLKDIDEFYEKIKEFVGKNNDSIEYKILDEIEGSLDIFVWYQNVKGDEVKKEKFIQKNIDRLELRKKIDY